MNNRRSRIAQHPDQEVRRQPTRHSEQCIDLAANNVAGGDIRVPARAAHVSPDPPVLGRARDQRRRLGRHWVAGVAEAPERVIGAEVVVVVRRGRLTENVQDALAASVAPDKLAEPDPAVAVMVPPPHDAVSPSMMKSQGRPGARR